MGWLYGKANVNVVKLNLCAADITKTAQKNNKRKKNLSTSTRWPLHEKQECSLMQVNFFTHWHRLTLRVLADVFGLTLLCVFVNLALAPCSLARRAHSVCLSSSATGPACAQHRTNIAWPLAGSRWLGIMLTILFAADDSSRQPTRHLSSIFFPSLTGLQNIKYNVPFLRGERQIDTLAGLNFSPSFPFHPSLSALRCPFQLLKSSLPFPLENS